MITPAQAKAARALLGWSQDDLARRSGVVRRTLMSFETGAREPREDTLLRVVETFEQAGIEFVSRRNVSGVLLRTHR
jgi:transcriptional regulator with XRE-family HTH domain